MVLTLLIAASLSAPPGEIAFLGRGPEGETSAYVITLERGTVRKIGPEHADGSPRWSPDGAQLAIAIRSEAGRSLYIADADGAGGRFLSNAHSISSDPEWSPIGSKLSYTVGEGLDTQIVVYDLESDQVLPWGGGRTSLSSPRWLSERLARLLLEPDLRGASALLSPLRGGARLPELLIAVGMMGSPGAVTTDLFVVSPQDVTPISPLLMPSPGQFVEFSPAVSPDALAFESNDGGDREIYVMSRQKTFNLSNYHEADWSPVWSPDGDWIAFESFRNGRRGVYRCLPRVAARTQAVAQDGDGDCWGPAWSPDGEWLAVVSNATGEPAISIIRATGLDRTRVSPEGVSAQFPEWRPTP